MALSRRGFIAAGAGLAGAAGLAALALRRTVQPHRLARGIYGPLRRDPRRLLDLPEGFSYRILQRRGERMSDGHRAPWQPDAMATFAGEGDEAGTVILVRNHECGTDSIQGPWQPGQSPAKQAYTPSGMGGVSRLVLDASTFELRSSNLVLAGTQRNCAGGPSPWGWITCEETFEEGHGFAFLCDPHAKVLQAPRRLDGYGRFRHEAAAVDPDTHVAYLTEDMSDGCFYRFVPQEKDRPFEGRLQALAVVDRPAYDTSESGWHVGERVEVGWIDVDDPTPRVDDLRLRARDAGAARVRRGEGLWWSEGGVYITATKGGPSEAGQILRYEPYDAEGGSLQLFAQAHGTDLLNMPDNLTVAPWGHVFACEDNGRQNHLCVFTPEGEIFHFARNAVSSGEFAGVCFSPDGRALFVNLQDEGLTFAITGPWQDVRV